MATNNHKEWLQLILEVVKEPTHVQELANDDADVVAMLYVSCEGSGRVWLLGKLPFEPTIWCVE